MPISRTINGVNLDHAQSRIEELLLALPDDPSVEAELLKLYEQASGFRPDCSVCIAGRKLFMNALNDFKNGEKLEGVAKLKGSMRSVRFKWSQMLGKFGI